MNLSFPFWRFPLARGNMLYYKKKDYNSLQLDNVKKSETNHKESEETKRSSFTDTRISEDDYLNIFGVKLHYDDILLISLIFFLYNEGVEDKELLLSLILLLLS